MAIANEKVSQLPAVTTPTNSDYFLIVQSGVTSQITYQNFSKQLRTLSATTIASSATPSINTDTTSLFTITALATAITSFTTNLTGTPLAGQSLIIRILDNGTARAITWGAKFVNRGGTLPTTTILGKYVYIGFLWNEITSTWDCISVSQE